ncbi:rhomboid family intramembrane serine protease [Flavobacterium psychrophilum]
MTIIYYLLVYYLLSSMKETDFKFSLSVLAWPLYLVLLLWLVYTVEIVFPGNFSHFGIWPRTVWGLRGIVLSPFLHGDIGHLFNNSIPLFVLVAALRFFYRRESLKVLILGVLFSGFGTWLIGRESYHIGASGLIYVLVSFIFFKGIQSGYFRLVALSLAIVVVYGGMIWFVFPSAEENISWEGHLSGFIAGYLLAFYTKRTKYEKPIRYDWERADFDPSQDEFMKHFDDNGNFVPISRVVVEQELSSYFVFNPIVNYEFVKSKEANNFMNSPDRGDSSR